MSALVIYSCLSVNSRNLLPCLLTLYVKFLSSNRDGVQPMRLLIPLMFVFLTKLLLFGVEPSKMLVSCGLTHISRWSSFWIPPSVSVPVFDVLLWLVDDVVLVIGREAVLVIAFSIFVPPALLVFAFPQLFLIVRITSLPIWHSFKDFLLLLFFPIVDIFVDSNSSSTRSVPICLFRLLREMRQLTCCLLSFANCPPGLQPAKYEFSGSLRIILILVWRILISFNSCRVL